MPCASHQSAKRRQFWIDAPPSRQPAPQVPLVCSFSETGTTPKYFQCLSWPRKPTATRIAPLTASAQGSQALTVIRPEGTLEWAARNEAHCGQHPASLCWKPQQKDRSPRACIPIRELLILYLDGESAHRSPNPSFCINRFLSLKRGHIHQSENSLPWRNKYFAAAVAFNVFWNDVRSFRGLCSLQRVRLGLAVLPAARRENSRAGAAFPALCQARGFSASTHPQERPAHAALRRSSTYGIEY